MIKQQIDFNEEAVVLAGFGRLGQTLATYLLKSNARVVALDNNPEQINRFARKLESSTSRRFLGYSVDLTSRQETFAAFKDFNRRWPKSLCGMIHGVSAREAFRNEDSSVTHGGLFEIDSAHMDLKDMIIESAINTTQAAIKIILEREVTDHEGLPYRGMILIAGSSDLYGTRSKLVYPMAKAALPQLARNIATNFGVHGIGSLYIRMSGTTRKNEGSIESELSKDQITILRRNLYRLRTGPEAFPTYEHYARMITSFLHPDWVQGTGGIVTLDGGRHAIDRAWGVLHDANPEIFSESVYTEMRGKEEFDQLWDSLTPLKPTYN